MPPAADSSGPGPAGSRGPPAIEAKGLTKRYGDFTAVQELNLTVQAGEVFGFLGPNGAGKSTTTKMLTTLIRPTEGEARVAGHDVAKDPLGVRRAIGYLPERVPVYATMTAREYLHTFGRLHGIPRAERGDRVESLLARVNLKGVEGKPVGKFSKGMTQRLGLARALINEPQVLFLDEPASGLDPTGRKEIRALINDISGGGTTVFLCTHDLAEAQAVCDRVGVIRDGRLVRVQAVGELGQGVRALEVELERVSREVLQALRGVPGVQRLGRRDGRIVVEYRAPASRQEVARAIQRAGGLILGMNEEAPSLERVYEEAVGEVGADGEATAAAEGAAPVRAEGAADGGREV